MKKGEVFPTLLWDDTVGVYDPDGFLYKIVDLTHYRTDKAKTEILKVVLTDHEGGNLWRCQRYIFGPVIQPWELKKIEHDRRIRNIHDDW